MLSIYLISMIIKWGTTLVKFVRISVVTGYHNIIKASSNVEFNHSMFLFLYISN